MANPLDTLSNINKPTGGAPKTTGPKKEKKSAFKSFSSPIIKELRGVGIYAIISASVLGAGYYIMSDETSPYYYGHLTEESKLVQETKARILESATQVEKLSNDVYNLNLEIQDKERIANEASLLKTPLDQGFYFTAYLDALADKYNIEIKNLDVQVKEEGTGANTAPVPIEQAVTTQDYSLLPISVTMKGSYESIVSLFGDIYTKRIIYDRNLNLVNHSDGTVTVSTLITFDNANVTEGAQTSLTGVPQVDANGQIIDPNQQTTAQPVDGTTTGAPPVPATTTVDPNASANVSPQPIEGGATNGN